MVWSEEIIFSDFAGKVSIPERNRRVRCFFDWHRSNFSMRRNDDLTLVEGEDSNWVAEGEFVEDFDYWDERHGEEDHLWIEDHTKDFLDLGK